MENPLVSIIVITYNSSKYVLETLESAKTQTYENIELIISDDGSSDETVYICEEWLTGNNDRFVNSELLVVEKNTGLPANCNRGVNAAQGEWIKLIAGDDMLKESAIEDYINFVSCDKTIRIVQANADYYQEYFLSENYKATTNNINHQINRSLNPFYQYKILLWAPSLNAPTVFINKSIFMQVGLFNEKFWMEDWPMWLKISKQGFVIWTLDKVTVNYRINSSSISNKDRNLKLFSDIYIKLHQFRKEHLYEELTVLDKFISELEYWLHQSFEYLGLNKNKLLNKILYIAMRRTFVDSYKNARALFYKFKY